MTLLTEGTSPIVSFKERHLVLASLTPDTYPKSVHFQLGGRLDSTTHAMYGQQLKSAVEGAVELAGSPIQEALITVEPDSEADQAYALTYLELVITRMIPEIKRRNMKINWYGADILSNPSHRVDFARLLEETAQNTGLALNLVIGESPPTTPGLKVTPVITDRLDSVTGRSEKVPLFTQNAIEGAILNFSANAHSGSSV